MTDWQEQERREAAAQQQPVNDYLAHVSEQAREEAEREDREQREKLRDLVKRHGARTVTAIMKSTNPHFEFPKDVADCEDME